MRVLFSILVCIAYVELATCAVQEIHLTIHPKTVKFTEKEAVAFAINDQIPAPTLRFKEGDDVIIHIHNRIDESTSIHWHGLLLPWEMDGVEGITQDGIQPGHTYTYTFKLKQSGTYWYHAHAGLQEQQGVYGAFIIDPVEPVHEYTKDFTVVMSDWSDIGGEGILANLKKDGDYYTPKFPIQPSLKRFLDDYDQAGTETRKKLLDDYLMMQDMRMSIYDLSDVAYDSYLLNGKTKQAPWTAEVALGDVVRLRFVGASGSTRYQIKIPGTVLKVIHVQGNDVEPYKTPHVTLSPGETIDVLVKIEKNQPYLIYAESADTRGHALGILQTEHQTQKYNRNVAPFPTPEPVVSGHHHMSMDEHRHMHNPMTMGTKYQDLRSSFKTNNPDLPVEVIHLELNGYMGRYIWFINGLTEHEAKPIVIQPGKRYRLIFTNQSMMIHPMHIHGHFFILRNGNGEYDPLLHTIEVAPGATVVADFDADTSGQWFFHCHHLFHMLSGMARVFQYSTLKTDTLTDQQKHLVDHPMAHPQHMSQSAHLEAAYDPFHNVQKANLEYTLGYDYQKLQLYTEDAELNKGRIESADIDVFYWHLISEFWALKGGMNYFYKPGKKAYLQPGVGIEGTMPWFIDTHLRMYLYKGSFKFDMQLARDTQIDHNMYLRLGLRPIVATKRITQAEIGAGLNQIEYIARPFWIINPGCSLYFELNHKQTYGQTKRLYRADNHATHETNWLFGISLLR